MLYCRTFPSVQDLGLPAYKLLFTSMVMCECLSFMLATWNKFWRPLIYPAIEVGLLEDGRLDSPPPQGDGDSHQKTSAELGRGGPGKHAVFVLNPERSKDVVADCKIKKKAAKMVSADSALTDKPQSRYASNGGSNKVSLFTKRGLKGINQDTMLVLERFASLGDAVFCGVFDGHGPDGHLVARNVRDILPQKLASSWQSQQQATKGRAFSSEDSETDSLCLRECDLFGEFDEDASLITAWKESFVTAYKLMDRELLINDHVDCVSSGTTAVTLVKQGNDLIVGNVGDSRAVLGMRADDNSMLALQLTVDLKPNVPREAERIKRYKGRVFALQKEPSVHRVWLPHHNVPGLAMARALGDYCLKNYGVISEPEVTYRHLTKKDEFVVLATDGVWDVLSNEQVVEIVASACDKSLAARAVVESAVHTWKSKHATSKVDDCAVVCLFL